MLDDKNKAVKTATTGSFCGYWAAIRKIKESMSPKERSVDLMLERLYRFVLHGDMVQAKTLAKAILILSPCSGVAIADARFRALWKLRKYVQAIRVYRQVGRMFWHAEVVGRHYERQGRLDRAVVEFEYLVSEYNNMRKDFLPMPSGPRELLVLAKWYADKDRPKARAYLKTYLRAGKVWPAYRLRHKFSAMALLRKLS